MRGVCTYHLPGSDLRGSRVMDRPGVWIGDLCKDLCAVIHSENKSFIVQAFDALQNSSTYRRGQSRHRPRHEKQTMVGALASLNRLIDQLRQVELDVTFRQFLLLIFPVGTLSTKGLPDKVRISLQPTLTSITVQVGLRNQFI